MHEDHAGWVEAAGSHHLALAGAKRAQCGVPVYGVRRPEPKRGRACRRCVRLEMGFDEAEAGA